jgi:hypothetical protein
MSQLLRKKQRRMEDDEVKKETKNNKVAEDERIEHREGGIAERGKYKEKYKKLVPYCNGSLTSAFLSARLLLPLLLFIDVWNSSLELLSPRFGAVIILLIYASRWALVE